MTAPETYPQVAQRLGRRWVVWRWVFLCALTSLATLLYTWWSHGPFLISAYHPRRAAFVGVTYITLTVFLLLVSPFFFRRLGGLAVLAWFTAIWAAIWISLPVF